MKKLVSALAFLFAACNGGSTNPNDTSIVALRVSPANPVVQQNATIAFVATAFQVNGEARPVTDDVEWSTTAASIVSISADGRATAENPGEAFITASLNDLSSPSQKVTVSAIPSPTPTPTPAPTATYVVISEVLFNAVVEPAGEFIELHNPTGTSVSLDGWQIRIDGGATIYVTFPGGATIPANGYVVACNDPGPSGCNIAGAFDGTGTLVNSGGEWIVLRDASSAVIDEMAYGSGNSGDPAQRPVGWCATTSGPSVTASDGNSVQRKPVGSDGNNCNDWISNTPATPLAPPP